MSAPASDDEGASSVPVQNKRDDTGSPANIPMTLTTRLAIAMILLVTVTVAAVGWLGYRNITQAVIRGSWSGSKPSRGCWRRILNPTFPASAAI